MKHPFPVLSGAAAFAGLALSLFVVLPAHAEEPVILGDLIKGESSNAVYYYYGNRYAFPNEDVYFSWYDDFSKVKTVSDDVLASIPLAANMRYRPGTRLIKIESDPKVYFLEDSKTLAWIPTEEDAAVLYGADWASEVRDVPVSLFTDYTVNEATSPFIYEGEREYVRGRYPDPESVYGVESLDNLTAIFSPDATSSIDNLPVPPGIDPAPLFNGYTAETTESSETLAPFFINDALNSGWSMAADETVSLVYDVYDPPLLYHGRLMRFEKQQSGSDLVRFVFLGTSENMSTMVAFDQLTVPDGLFFPDKMFSLASYGDDSMTSLTGLAFLSASELKQWYLSQALSHGWLYMGEESYRGSSNTNQLFFKSQKNNDWFTLLISQQEDLGLNASSTSSMADTQVTLVTMHLIDVRD